LKITGIKIQIAAAGSFSNSQFFSKPSTFRH
jgi:hypothetical protein